MSEHIPTFGADRSGHPALVPEPEPVAAPLPYAVMPAPGFDAEFVERCNAATHELASS